MKTVHVVGGNGGISRMFVSHGWVLVDAIEDADLVQFCGGVDVWPGLYLERPHPKSHFDTDRDTYERAMYDMAFENGCAIAGICRGAQFVHVMNGGYLWQHVDGHALGKSDTHITYFHGETNGFHVSSTHHQMMKEGVGEVILSSRISKSKEDGGGASLIMSDYFQDVECMYHVESNSLCYQPHPEYFSSTHMCQKFYFQTIKTLLGVPETKEVAA